MTEQEFTATFGFTPNVHELRLAAGRDPLDEAKAYDPANYGGQTLAQYHVIWSKRGNRETLDLRCSHRTAEVKRVGTCNLCGIKGQPMDVYGCDQFIECTLTRKHSDIRSCVSCEHRDTPRPVISFCMPHYNDWPGVWATVAGILKDAVAANVLDQIEIVVGDQTPDTGDGRKVKDYLGYVPNSKYVALPPHGSARAKDDTIKAASGKWFCLIDCHAIFQSGSLAAIVAYAALHADSPDIHGGAILTQTLARNEYSSHLDNVWQGNTLGRWQRDPRAADPSAEPFDVPNLAGWFLLGNRDAWATVAPYRPEFRGFGGEEGVMSMAYRANGRRVLCLPLARAEHRFGYANGPTFKNDIADRVRNYAMAFRHFHDVGEMERMETYFTHGRAEDTTLKSDKRNWTVDEFDRVVMGGEPGGIGEGTKGTTIPPVMAPTAADVFTAIHDRKAWGDGESVSGPGSSLVATETIRRELPKLFADLGMESLLDLPCGDHHWMAAMLDTMPAIEYFGGDVVPLLIARNRRRFPLRRFQFIDILTDQTPVSDLVLVRDCFVHLPFVDIHKALANLIASGSRWLLATTFPGRTNVDCRLGEWRPLDLTAAPFNLPPPTKLINEGCTEGGGTFADKSLGLWDLYALATAEKPHPLASIMEALADAEASDAYSVMIARRHGTELKTTHQTTRNFTRRNVTDSASEYLRIARAMK